MQQLPSSLSDHAAPVPNGLHKRMLDGNRGASARPRPSEILSARRCEPVINASLCAGAQCIIVRANAGRRWREVARVFARCASGQRVGQAPIIAPGQSRAAARLNLQIHASLCCPFNLYRSVHCLAFYRSHRDFCSGATPHYGPPGEVRYRALFTAWLARCRDYIMFADNIIKIDCCLGTILMQSLTPPTEWEYNKGRVQKSVGM